MVATARAGTSHLHVALVPFVYGRRVCGVWEEGGWCVEGGWVVYGRRVWERVGGIWEEGVWERVGGV